MNKIVKVNLNNVKENTHPDVSAYVMNFNFVVI